MISFNMRDLVSYVYLKAKFWYSGIVFIQALLCTGLLNITSMSHMIPFEQNN